MNKTYDQKLRDMLGISGIDVNACYKTEQVARVLGTSTKTIRQMCNRWEPNSHDGIESYLIGTHRRIPHHGIVYWLEANSSYSRKG